MFRLRWGREWGHPFDRKRRLLTRRPTFAEYLDDIAGFNRRLGFSCSGEDLTRQREALSIDGELAMDQIVRFDDLEAGFGEVCARLGVASYSLPHLLESQPRRHYSEYYTAKLRDRVAELYADDIDAFGFVFESPRGPLRG